MYTVPKIHHPTTDGARAFISYYYNGKRYKEYNGNRLNIKLSPNHSSSDKDKSRLLKQLQYEFAKALEKGWNPLLKDKEIPNVKDAFDTVLSDKLSSNLAELYKRNLKGVHRMFLDFLTKSELKSTCDELELNRVDEFLSKFKSSERNYINRRRLLGTFFNEIVRKGYGVKNHIQFTASAKAKATLHVPYTEKQLKEVLNFLKTDYPNLYLCCLLTYGCLLRPHHEVRFLKLRHIVKDFTQIQLSGNENKSKRIRTVYVPQYVQTELRARLATVSDPETNIFTLTSKPYGVAYFNVLWGKAKVRMLKDKLIEKNQTIYSFRHTAAIGVYQKTKDLHILQQLLQHSNMIVTLNYLRGLGEINDDRLKESLPELNL